MLFSYFSTGLLIFSLVFLYWHIRKGKKLSSMMKKDLVRMLTVTEMVIINSELLDRLLELGDTEFILNKRVEMMERVMSKFDELL